jgi:hypothetical protein
LTPLTAGLRHFPHPWIEPSGQNVTGEYVEWVKPLAGTIEELPKL